MQIEKVEYKDGRAFVRYIHKTGKLKGYLKRDYGQIIICPVCGEKAFARDGGIKDGRGKFCSIKCARQLKNNPKWKNGVKKHSGYILIKSPTHPYRNSQGYVYEHRLIVEKMIGRYLHRYEVIHHINGIKNNNHHGNLMCFRNRSVHKRFEIGQIVKDRDIVFNGKV